MCWPVSLARRAGPPAWIIACARAWRGCRGSESRPGSVSVPGGALVKRVGVRRFRIGVRHCKGCGREWPAHLAVCRECAASLGEARMLVCCRLAVRCDPSKLPETVAVVAAIELSSRCCGDQTWVGGIWEQLEPLLADAIRVDAAPAGSVVAAWPLDHPHCLAGVASRPMEVSESFRGGQVELRGALAIGMVGGRRRHTAVERYAERLALTAPRPVAGLRGDRPPGEIKLRARWRWHGRAMAGPLAACRNRAAPAAHADEVPIGRARRAAVVRAGTRARVRATAGRMRSRGRRRQANRRGLGAGRRWQVPPPPEGSGGHRSGSRRRGRLSGARRTSNGADARDARGARP